MKNYVMSKDYERLWSLVQEGKKIPCLYQDDGIQRAGLAQKICGTPTPPCRGFCINKDIFIKCCEKNKVEMLLPNEWIKIEDPEDVPQGENFLFCIADSKRVIEGTRAGEWVYSADSAKSIKAFSHYKPMPEAPRI